MEMDVTQVLVNMEGENITRTVGEEVMDLTLRRILVQALLEEPGQEKIKGEEKLDRYLLAQKIQTEDNPDFSLEQRSRMKTMVSNTFTPIVVGQVWIMLDPELADKEPTLAKKQPIRSNKKKGGKK